MPLTVVFFSQKGYIYVSDWSLVLRIGRLISCHNQQFVSRLDFLPREPFAPHLGPRWLVSCLPGLCPRRSRGAPLGLLWLACLPHSALVLALPAAIRMRGFRLWYGRLETSMCSSLYCRIFKSSSIAMPCHTNDSTSRPIGPSGLMSMSHFGS